jgi:hypothetical protein
VKLLVKRFSHRFGELTKPLDIAITKIVSNACLREIE